MRWIDAVWISLALGLVAVAADRAPAAGPPAGSEWLAVADTGDAAIGLGDLFDSSSAYPSNRTSNETRAIERGYLQHLPYMAENEGDYLLAVVYVDTASRWCIGPETRVALSYGDRVLESLEILVLGCDQGMSMVPTFVLSSTDLFVCDPSRRDLFRSDSGGFRGFVRFAPGTLPRSARGFLWFGGSQWGVIRPDTARVVRGG